MAVKDQFIPVVPLLLPFLCLSSSLTYYYGDGSYYTGSVDGDGRPREGVAYSREDVVRYNGSWLGGLYHGDGSWYGEGGESYQGQFRGGEASGRGVWTSGETGERLVGQFENGAVSGEAVWYRPGAGVRLEGEFKRGHAHGPGVVYWADAGYRLSSPFKKGYPHGQAELYFPNNTLAWAGRFTNGAAGGDNKVEQVEDMFSLFTDQPFRSKIRFWKS
eukprot:GFUD01034692.1.p1 GENE.GFUD01034692.1~~GFUD01034692.1.p1  ORF type:complete len:217 (-),score=47.68 GFUD01034692.1:24-674(-)